MSLDLFQRYFIYDYAMQSMQTDMLSSAYLPGLAVGANLRSMILASQPVQPLTNPFDEAITGTLRADAAATRQNADNAGEAASMMGIAKEGVSQIKDALASMEDIIDKINAGELSAGSATVQAEYDALRDKITGIISGTDYNGISMLDSTKWGTDQISATGAVSIQGLKNAAFDINFTALDGYGWSSLKGSDLADAGTRATQLSQVESLSSDIDAVLGTYESREASLEFQQQSLESQAGLLDQAVTARRQSTTTTDLEQLLVNLLLKETGSLVDSSS